MPETTTQRLHLSFGYNGFPAHVTAAWGARWLTKQDGTITFVHDRQGTAGDPAECKRILARLNDGAGAAAQQRASGLLRSYAMKTREAEEVTLYLDPADGFTVLGNTNASAGYLYICAYFSR